MQATTINYDLPAAPAPHLPLARVCGAEGARLTRKRDGIKWAVSVKKPPDVLKYS